MERITAGRITMKLRTSPETELTVDGSAELAINEPRRYAIPVAAAKPTTSMIPRISGLLRIERTPIRLNAPPAVALSWDNRRLFVITQVLCKEVIA
jgi:hypothetical protein